jgi:hypothetical protein
MADVEMRKPGSPDRATGAQDTEAWRLQFEYVEWRRRTGLDPERSRLNRWQQAMDRIGELSA